MTLERKRPAFVPTWEGPIAAWTTKYCRRQEWRTLPAFSAEDLVQECAVKFLLLCERYATVTEPRHFMSLYMRSCLNLINDLAAQRSKERAYSISGSPLAGETDFSDLSSSVVATDGGMVELFSKLELDDAPELISQLIEALLPLDEPPALAYKNGRRETTADYLRRVSGAPAGSDVLGAAADFLGVSRNAVSAH